MWITYTPVFYNRQSVLKIMVGLFKRKLIPYEMKRLGIYLKQLREEANFSIREAAKKSGISPSYLFKIESGKSFSTLSIHSIIKLSQTYNIPITALLKEAGFLKDDEYNLPEFSQYLLAKYNLTPQAIQDMEIAKEIVEKKYKQ